MRAHIVEIEHIHHLDHAQITATVLYMCIYKHKLHQYMALESDPIDCGKAPCAVSELMELPYATPWT